MRVSPSTSERWPACSIASPSSVTSRRDRASLTEVTDGNGWDVIGGAVIGLEGEAVEPVVVGVRGVGERPVLLNTTEPCWGIQFHAEREGIAVHAGSSDLSTNLGYLGRWRTNCSDRVLDGTRWRRSRCCQCAVIRLERSRHPVVVRLWRVAERPVLVEHERTGSDRQPGCRSGVAVHVGGSGWAADVSSASPRNRRRYWSVVHWGDGDRDGTNVAGSTVPVRLVVVVGAAVSAIRRVERPTSSA